MKYNLERQVVTLGFRGVEIVLGFPNAPRQAGLDHTRLRRVAFGDPSQSTGFELLGLSQ